MRSNPLRRAAVVAALTATALVGASTLAGCVSTFSEFPDGSIVVKKDGVRSIEKSGASIKAEGKKVSVESNGSDATITCTGGEEIDILGDDDSTITLKGSCGHVEALASHHKIIAETISGIALIGSDTTVSVGTIEKDIVVTGTNNEIEYDTYKGSADPVLIGAFITYGEKGGTKTTSTPTPAATSAP